MSRFAVDNWILFPFGSSISDDASGYLDLWLLIWLLGMNNPNDLIGLKGDGFRPNQCNFDKLKKSVDT